MTARLEIAVRWPVATLIGIALLTAVALAGIFDPSTGELRLRIDPSTDGLVSSESSAKRYYQRIRRVFGSDERLVITLSGDSLLAPENLERLVRITDRLERTAGVRRVLSLATAVNIRSVGGEIEVATFLDPMPGDAPGRARLREQVRENPLYRQTLVSADGRTTAIFVTFDAHSDRELIESGLEERVIGLVREEAGELEVAVTGSPHLKVRTSAILIESLYFILPAIFAVTAVVLLLAFRSVRGALLPIAAIAIALVWTLGTVGWLGCSLNLVTTIVPPLVITVGFAYAMHVLSEYYDSVRELGPTAARAEISRRAVREVSLPVAVTGLTTAVGLVSLTLSPMQAIREFGLFATAGVVYTVVVSLTFVPALLRLLPLPRRRASLEAGGALRRAAEGLADFDFFNRRWIIASSLVLLAVSTWSASQVEVGTDHIESFRESSPVRRDYQRINAELGGVNTFYVVFESPLPEAFLAPENLREMRAFQRWLAGQPEIGGSSSIADYLMLLNRAMQGGDPRSFAIPETKELAMQLFFFGASDETERMIDSRFQTSVIAVRSKEQGSRAIADLVDRVEARLARLPARLSARVTGDVILLNGAIDEIARGQVKSLAAAGAVVYLVLSAMFMSLRIGLVALFPNLLPIALYFGALALTGVTLNPSTSLVACVALGIAVDDTIHYFARFNRDAKRSAREVPATRSALRSVIRPVTCTSAGLCLGFLLLMASGLRSQAEFGALAAFTMAAAWLIDVTLTPALCSSVRIVTLWDVLRLDLGPEPHRSIELFHGLSVRQARIAALMGSIEVLPAGAALHREGEIADAMYVVLEGELLLSTERGGSRVDLAVVARGQVVGQTGLFNERRPLDVDALTDVKLMRVTRVDLERIGRRYPRVAAGLYRNLNRIQARRISSLIQAGALSKPQPEPRSGSG